MTIAARFPGTCRRCRGAIAVGEQINWERGAGAAHVVCPAAAPPPPPVLLGIPNIRKFLQNAVDSGLKRPAVRFLGPDGTSELRLSFADRPQFLGNVRIRLGGEFIGRVDPQNAVHGRVTSMSSVLDELRTAELDPVAAARRYGALMQHCSFCGLPLTDAGSVELGYGPICAVSWNLPHVPLGVPEVRTVPVEQHLPTPVAATEGTDPV